MSNQNSGVIKRRKMSKNKVGPNYSIMDDEMQYRLFQETKLKEAFLDIVFTPFFPKKDC